MKIAVITHYYSPETGAPSARLSEMSREWVRNGHQVTVVTNFPNHPTGEIHKGYEGKSFMVETLDGVRVVRCRTLATPNKGLVFKTLAHLYFMVMSVFQGKQEIAGCDVIIVSSPTLFSVVGAWWLGLRLGIPYVFDVRDLWPGIFVELGVLKNRFVIWGLERLELFLYNKSSAVVTVTRAFKADIANRGVPETKIHFVPNGVDVARYAASPKSTELAMRLGLEGKFIVLYCGAHGISHALGKIVDTAELLKGDRDVHFLFVGDGAEREQLIARTKQRGLGNVTFLPSQAKDEIPRFYNLADVCLVPLRNIPMFRTFIPSKMFEIMGCERPIVASVEGESEEIFRLAESAIVVPPEDSAAIARGIITLKGDSALGRRMGASGRRYVVANFSRELLARNYLDVFAGVLKK
ncbi:MAG: glycosyltransferase family 4 protein [Nitrospinae bacterium]|nr:glycosyltransferase family 4 protein [Nitrospinota bacterium]